MVWNDEPRTGAVAADVKKNLALGGQFTTPEAVLCMYHSVGSGWHFLVL